MHSLLLVNRVSAYRPGVEPPVQLQRATICFWSDSIEEKLDFTLWFTAWKRRMTYVSPDFGCGCCIHLFNVEGPKEAIDAIPAHLLAASDWTESDFGRNVENHL